MKAESIAKALGGRRTGSTWMARCPAHDDREPSLAIAEAKDGTVLVRCHAGCSQHDVIDALRGRGCTEGRTSTRQSIAPRVLRSDLLPAAESIQRTRTALAISQSSEPAEGTD